MNEEVKATIARLMKELKNQVQEVSDTKRVINRLSRTAGVDPPFPDAEPESLEGSSIRPDEYYGQPLGKSVQDFIKRHGTACTPEQIVSGLVSGGFDFDLQGWIGGKGDRARAMGSALAKNPAVFHRLPTGLWGLTVNYPEAAKRMDAERAAEKRAAKKSAKKRAAKAKPGVAPKAEPQRHEGAA
jgi:hypothetical protein